ncbi:polysaccharide biosynthesis C-terminal domain-containing protein [Haladaptatus sp. W1]|uniref:oligosaccharide flippase family protein n=1 Tax=Haladaptatus sp. W1 TaxID=1897478 RepID=UPI0020C80435|nr:polysaccharide biosynthesis C-terminal domain-containing protein [Haladaptatus sp. W1]
MLVCLLATESVYETIDSLVQGRGRISAATWVDTLRSVFTLPLQIGFVALLSTATVVGAAGMVYGLALASALVLPLAVVLVAARPAIPSRAFVRSLADYARYSIPSTLSGTTYDRLDVLLLGFLLVDGTSAVGWYEVAWKFTLPAVFVADMAGRGLMTTVSARNERVGGAAHDISNTLAYAGILAFPILFGSFALSNALVVTVYGPAYRNAAVLLVGLAAYRVVRAQSGPLLQAVNGFDRPDVAMRLSALAVGINLLLGVFLTLRFGPVGVVAATIVAESAVYLGALRFLRGELVGVEPVSRPMAAQVGASLVMFVVVSVAHASVPVASWTDLLSLVSLGGVVYVGILFAVSPGVRHTFTEAVRGSFSSP